MMSIVFGGIILTIVFGGAERLFLGGRTLKRGTLLSLFAALLFTISPVVSVFGRAVSVPTFIYVFVSVAVGFYRGSGRDRLFLTYVSVLVGVFLYFYGEAKSVSLFSSDIFYSANGVLLEVALTVVLAKTASDAVASAAISIFTYACLFTSFGKFCPLLPTEIFSALTLSQILSAAICIYAQKIARLVAPDAAFMLDEAKRA